MYIVYPSCFYWWFLVPSLCWCQRRIHTYMYIMHTYGFHIIPINFDWYLYTFQIPFLMRVRESLSKVSMLFFAQVHWNLEQLFDIWTFMVSLLWCALAHLIYPLYWRAAWQRAIGKRWTSSLVDLNAWRAWSMYRHMSMNIPIELVFTPCIFFLRMNTFPMMSFIDYTYFFVFFWVSWVPLWNVLEFFLFVLSPHWNLG